MAVSNFYDDIVLLIGNGVSIAHERSLSVPALSQEIIDVFSNLDTLGMKVPGTPSGVAKALAEASRKLGGKGDSETNFELLLAPLEDVSEALEELRNAVGLYKSVDAQIDEKLSEVVNFTNYVRRLGLSHVLEIIEKNSRGGSGNVYSEFISKISSVTEGNVLLATLNYDQLLDSAILSSKYRTSDIASGQAVTKIRLNRTSNHEIQGLGIRNEFDYADKGGWCWQENRRHTVLHLHGSLALVRNYRTGVISKCKMDDLRDQDFWRLYREDFTDFEPVVVLTNQHRKSRLVAMEPFRRAYSGLRIRLRDSQRWVIAGYSFQDECVNEVLYTAWSSMSVKPRILISTHGSELSDITIKKAILGPNYEADLSSRILSLFDANFGVDRSGVDVIDQGASWGEWVENF